MSAATAEANPPSPSSAAGFDDEPWVTVEDDASVSVTHDTHAFETSCSVRYNHWYLRKSAWERIKLLPPDERRIALDAEVTARRSRRPNRSNG